ncbi:MAG TPA: DUF3786 domain-containing protein [Dissulfurispiraceae bacterium]|nr:DUF3786 domain-containing protein [Dissulfurispiraceae bacterium]
MNTPGEDRACEVLSRRSQEDIVRCAGAHVEPFTEDYQFWSLGAYLRVNPRQKTFEAQDALGAELMKKISRFWRLTSLWYLASAQDLPLTGRLISPQEIKAGLAFFQGSHALPLQQLAGHYGNSPEGFLGAARRLGGTKQNYGDAAMQIPAYPRIPVTIILWCADEEFPARTALLFDASAPNHLPVDALWSAAMMTLLALL